MNTDCRNILLEQMGDVMVITLNRPGSYNSISDEMADELENAFNMCNQTSSIRAVLLCGKGENFCSGGDVKEMLQKRAEDNHDWAHDTARFNQMALAFFNLDKITICAVNGVAAGAGCNLAIGADFTFASENAKFIEIFTNIGLMPDAGGMYILPRIVGIKKATELMITHRAVSAQEALNLGMVYKVIPNTQLMDTALTFAQKVASGPTLAHRYIKRLLRRTYSSTLENILTDEAKYQSILSSSKDLGKGLDAFLQKSAPVFTGE